MSVPPDSLAAIARDAIEILPVAEQLWNEAHPREPDEVFCDLRARCKAVLAQQAAPVAGRQAVSYRLWWRNNGTGPGLAGNKQFDSLRAAAQYLKLLPQACVLDRLERTTVITRHEAVLDPQAALAAAEQG